MRSRCSPAAVALVAAMLAACAPAPTPPATSIPDGGDCSDLLGVPAEQVAAALAERGITPFWRLEYTDPEHGPVSETVEEPPHGVVTNIITTGDEVVVFVAPADDPLGEFAPSSLPCP